MITLSVQVKPSALKVRGRGNPRRPKLTLEAALSVKEHQPLFEAVAEEPPPCENDTELNVVCVCLPQKGLHVFTSVLLVQTV